MQQKNIRILLLLTTMISVYGCYLQIDFLISYIIDPKTQYSHEYLGGVFLVGFLFSFAWISSLVLLAWKESYFSTTERIVAFIPSLLIVVNCLLSLAL
jgi:hypothetical protein